MAGIGQAEEKGDGSMNSEDDNIAKSYLDVKMDEASAQFDITMHYVDQAILAERERCAQIATQPAIAFRLGSNTFDPVKQLTCESIAKLFDAVAARIRSGEI